MFTFGFSEPDQEKHDKNNEESPASLTWFPASEIEVKHEQIEKQTPEEYTEIVICSNNIKVTRLQDVVSKLINDGCTNVIKAESEHSDLLPAIYEGGLKIWECSYDLGTYLIEEGIDLKNKKVLDLGCGAGILGLLMLLKGSIVHFQDYNAEVIEVLTIPNVLLNLKDCQKLSDRCKFFSGDWKSFTDLLSSGHSHEDDKYDIIVTSETIYNPCNQMKLYEVFKQRLKTDGVGYIAGKTYYFGVGGGMRQFETLIQEDGIFNSKVVWKSSEGVQREIIELKRHKT